MAAEVTTPARVVDDARLLMRTVRDEAEAGRRPYASDIRRLIERALALKFQAYVQFLERYGYIDLDRRADLLTLTKAGEAAVAGRETQLEGMAEDAKHHFGDQLVDRPAAARPSAGVRLDTRYLRLESIGRGGLGKVWRGRLLSVDRPVAIKMLDTLDEVFRPDQRQAVVRRFERAVREHARLVSPYIVQILDQNPDHAPPYFVMELAPGGNLKGLLDGGPLEPSVAMRYFIQIALGLKSAHAEGVVHRDLKPENVLLDATGNVKLSDFGLTRIAERDGATMRRAYVGYGSLGYMAPELFRGGEGATPAADVYALGILLYEMLVGDLPGRRSPLPSAVIEGLPDAVDDIFDRMARDDLEGRMETIDEALEAVFGSQAICELLDVKGAPGFIAPPRPLPGLPEGEMPEEATPAHPAPLDPTAGRPPRTMAPSGDDPSGASASGYRADSRAPAERRPRPSAPIPRDEEPSPAPVAQPPVPEPAHAAEPTPAPAPVEPGGERTVAFEPDVADEPAQPEPAAGALPSDGPADAEPVDAEPADAAPADDALADAVPLDAVAADDSLDGATEAFDDEPTGALKLSDLGLEAPAAEGPITAPPASIPPAEADMPASSPPADAAMGEDTGEPEAAPPAAASPPTAETPAPTTDAPMAEAPTTDAPTTDAPEQAVEPTPRPRQFPAPRASISVTPRAHAPRPRASITRGSTGPYPSAIRDRASQARLDATPLKAEPTPPVRAADPDRTAALSPITDDQLAELPPSGRTVARPAPAIDDEPTLGADELMMEIPLPDPDSIDEPLDDLLDAAPEIIEEAEILQSGDFEPLDVPAAAYDALPSAEPRPVARVVSASSPMAEEDPTYKVSMKTNALRLDELEILEDLDDATGERPSPRRTASQSEQDLGAGVEARLKRLRDNK